MAYIDPKTVVSPKHIVDQVEVVFDAGPVEQSWAVATLSWEHKDAVGIRWNGEPLGKGIGTPQARGVPTWFIVPEELQDTVLEAARKLAHGNYDELKAGYAEMAKDSEHEREAYEWSEGLIADQANE